MWSIHPDGPAPRHDRTEQPPDRPDLPWEFRITLAETGRLLHQQALLEEALTHLRDHRF
jgi:hypothetical protein